MYMQLEAAGLIAGTEEYKRKHRREVMTMGHKECPYCGASLDPGEKCDCRGQEESPACGGAD